MLQPYPCYSVKDKIFLLQSARNSLETFYFHFKAQEAEADGEVSPFQTGAELCPQEVGGALELGTAPLGWRKDLSWWLKRRQSRRWSSGTKPSEGFEKSQGRENQEVDWRLGMQGRVCRELTWRPEVTKRLRHWHLPYRTLWLVSASTRQRGCA